MNPYSADKNAQNWRTAFGTFANFGGRGSLNFAVSFLGVTKEERGASQDSRTFNIRYFGKLYDVLLY